MESAINPKEKYDASEIRRCITYVETHYPGGVPGSWDRKSDHPVCTESGEFSCERSWNNVSCPHRHTHNPYRNSRMRLLFLFEYDHIIEQNSHDQDIKPNCKILSALSCTIANLKNNQKINIVGSAMQAIPKCKICLIKYVM